MRVRFCLAVLPVLLIAQPAFAEQSEEQKRHCSQDAYRFCDEYVPDALAVQECLRAHMRQLSPACRAEFAGGSKARRRHRH
jgi:hypothetical protein